MKMQGAMAALIAIFIVSLFWFGQNTRLYRNIDRRWFSFWKRVVEVVNATFIPKSFPDPSPRMKTWFESHSTIADLGMRIIGLFCILFYGSISYFGLRLFPYVMVGIESIKPEFTGIFEQIILLMPAILFLTGIFFTVWTLLVSGKILFNGYTVKTRTEVRS